MAYSNVTPPPLPEYDTETYGYYVLAFNYKIGEEDWYQVHLWYSAWRFHYEEGLGITNTANTFWRVYGDGSWTAEMPGPETLALTPGIYGNSYQRIYTNANIFNGNEIYLAENSVTPVDGAKFPLLDFVKGLIMAYCSPRRTFYKREPIYPADCLTFASAEPFSIAIEGSAKTWNGALYYSTDTTTWSEWDGTTAITSKQHGGEQRLYMRGSGNLVITDSLTASWALTGNNIRCEGNIETLLDYETVVHGQHPPMGSGCYEIMFYDCTSLTKAPELPATSLADWCYHAMFARCTGLTKAPELPATSLTEACYASMFDGCASLTQAPELPATTLMTQCYSRMFRGCASLTQVPELPAINLAMACYREMFGSCTSIKLSQNRTEEYPTEYRIPSVGAGVNDAFFSLSFMFDGTGGTFAGTPEINTTYYLHKDNSVVPSGPITVATLTDGELYIEEALAALNANILEVE